MQCVCACARVQGVPPLSAAALSTVAAAKGEEMRKTPLVFDVEVPTRSYMK